MLANVSPSVTVQLLFGALLVGLIICLALEEKLHAKKSVIVGLFAIVCLLLGEAIHLLPTREIVVGSHLIDPLLELIHELETHPVQRCIVDDDRRHRAIAFQK